MKIVASSIGVARAQRRCWLGSVLESLHTGPTKNVSLLNHYYSSSTGAKATESAFGATVLVNMDWIISSVDILSDVPRWYVGAILGTGFFTYYLREVVKQPILACSNGKFRDFLENNVPILKEKYWPTFWCFESRLQTIFASILRGFLPDLKYKREILKLNDGGEVGLDWQVEGCSEKSPIIIILPGLTGNSQSDYIKCLVQTASRIGVRTVVFNNRGLGGVSFKTARTYCAANNEDLTEVISYVKNKYPDVPLAATGISMGGLILGSFLAAKQESARKVLSAAMIISVPWNVFRGTESIEKPGVNLMLNKHLAGGLCDTVRRVKDNLSVGVEDLELVLQSKTIREFDSNYTAKQFGYKDVWDYYEAATLHDKLDKIRVPLLCLSAADDPFQPLEGIPVEAAYESKNVAIVITARGGHIGFMEGLLPLYQEQYMSRVFGQFYRAAFQNGDILSTFDSDD